MNTYVAIAISLVPSVPVYWFHHYMYGEYLKETARVSRILKGLWVLGPRLWYRHIRYRGVFWMKLAIIHSPLLLVPIGLSEHPLPEQVPFEDLAALGFFGGLLGVWVFFTSASIREEFDFSCCSADFTCRRFSGRLAVVGVGEDPGVGGQGRDNGSGRYPADDGPVLEEGTSENYRGYEYWNRAERDQQEERKHVPYGRSETQIRCGELRCHECGQQQYGDDPSLCAPSNQRWDQA